MEKINLDKIKARESYEKRTEGIANPSLIERLSRCFKKAEFSELKKKGITKEDIIKLDAELEFGARKAAEGKGLDSKEQKYLDKMANSSLSFSQEFGSMDDFGNFVKRYIIKGEINGQGVEVVESAHYQSKDRSKEGSYEGLLNGKKLIAEDAKKIFEEYSPIARERMMAISKLIEAKQKAISEMKRRADTEDSLKEIFPVEAGDE